MRFLAPALLIAFSCALPRAGRAQVSVDKGALDALRTEEAAHPAETRHPAARHAPARPRAHSRAEPRRREPAPPPAAPKSGAGGESGAAPKGGAPTESHSAAPPAPPPTPMPTLPTTPPPAAVLVPPAPVVPTRPEPPPPPVPVVAGAAGQVSPLPDGIRVTFGAGSSDLNPDTAAAIKEFGEQLLKDPALDVNLVASAVGAPDDPSTPRRLSLARALAVRAVLINEGIPSPRIYVRAMGGVAGQGPADRVDLLRARTSPQPAAAPGKAAAAPAATTTQVRAAPAGDASAPPPAGAAK